MPRKSSNARTRTRNKLDTRLQSTLESEDVDTDSCSRSTSPSNSASTTDTSSFASTDITRSPSPSPSLPTRRISASHSPISTNLLRATLRKRNHTTCATTSPRSDNNAVSFETRGNPVDKIPGDMFGTRKYTPLPTTVNGNGNGGGGPRRRAGGGMTAWKRWVLIGTGVVVVLGLAYTSIPARKAWVEDTWDNTYTPDLDSKPHQTDVDETDYSSPPFRPPNGHVGHPSTDEDEEDAISIQPVGDTHEHVHENPEDDDYLEYPAESGSSPHDPSADEALEAEHADPDFADIDDSDEDVEPTHPGLPTSFETDPNPEGTVVCSSPRSASKPLVQYALTIDAGSTGSRIHVYKFHNCRPSPTLEYETFKMINPGLSAFAKDPVAAAESLDVLLKEAQRVVPRSLWSCSPVEVKATAGLRLLGAEQSQAILDEVHRHIKNEYPFNIAPEGSVEVMDGKDEGVYAWITANYLLNRIGEGAKSTDTLAVMDLGGASTQIVFEPKFPSTTSKLAEGEHKYQLKFGGKEFTLYQHSYLGYGLMRARRSIHNLVAFSWSFSQGGDIEWDNLDEDVTVSNPCLSRGTTRRIELDPPGRKAVNVTMHGGNGGYEACNRVVELVMAKDAVCEVKPCSFNGVYQPSLLDSFQSGQFLALSYFTDRIKPLMSESSTSSSTGAQHLTVSDLGQMAVDVCAGSTSWKKRWGKNPTAMAELEDRPEYCLDLTFMRALLGLGYEIAPKRELVVEKKLKGVELGWSLGAGLALVQNAKLTCTA